ncbi:MAG TPA: phytanoyl-CoA dioxygenase family protein, partial [Gammaproteobacteria bacterium]
MLSDRQLEDFRRDGYLLIRGLYDRGEMRDITAWTDEVTAWPEMPGKYMMYFEQSKLAPGRRILCRMEDLEPYHAGFRELFCSGKMQGAVSDLLGEEAVLFKDKINFKLPGGGGFEPHQDQQAGWSTYAPLFVTVLV